MNCVALGFVGVLFRLANVTIIPGDKDDPSFNFEFVLSSFSAIFSEYLLQFGLLWWPNANRAEEEALGLTRLSGSLVELQI